MKPKKIKFKIELNGAAVGTLEELRANFNLKQIIEYLFDENKTLWRFLDVRGCEKEAAEIAALKPDTPNLQTRLYEIFGFEQPTEEFTIDGAETAAHKRRLDRLMAFTDNCAILDGIDRVAFDQAELNNLADSGVEEIYLCDGRFEIPLDKTGKTYVGVDGIAKPVAVIRSEKIVDFEKLDIRFKNLPFDDAYKKIAESPAAMFELGKSCYDGYGRIFKWIDAARWFEKAAEKNHIDAIYYLGRCYDSSESLDPAYKKAFGCFKKAAEKGQVNAMYWLGRYYFWGYGVDRNESEGIEWYKKAADADNSDAMYALGDQYFRCAESKSEGIEWYKKAAEKGSIYAKEILDRLGIKYNS